VIGWEDYYSRDIFRVPTKTKLKSYLL